MEKQRQVIEEKIKEFIISGDPVVVLPFDTYPIIEQEMKDAGWVYNSYIDQKTGKKCAYFLPKQYCNNYVEDEEVEKS